MLQGYEEVMFFSHSAPCASVVVSDEFVVAGYDGNAAPVALGSRSVYAEIGGHSRCITAIDMRPEMRRFVSVGLDSAITVWDLPSPVQIDEACSAGGVHRLAKDATFVDVQFQGTGPRTSLLRVTTRTECERTRQREEGVFLHTAVKKRALPRPVTPVERARGVSILLFNKVVFQFRTLPTGAGGGVSTSAVRLSTPIFNLTPPPSLSLSSERCAGSSHTHTHTHFFKITQIIKCVAGLVFVYPTMLIY